MRNVKTTENSKKVAAALLVWMGAAQTCLSNKKRKTAAMKRRLNDLKIIDDQVDEASDYQDWRE